MSVHVRERRRGSRMSVSHPVTLRDRRGRVLLRGRTSDISQRGLYCLTECRRGLRLKGRVMLEITLPAGRAPRRRHATQRTARHAGRIVRVEEIGQLVGLAIELIDRL